MLSILEKILYSLLLTLCLSIYISDFLLYTNVYWPATEVHNKSLNGWHNTKYTYNCSYILITILFLTIFFDIQRILIGITKFIVLLYINLQDDIEAIILVYTYSMIFSLTLLYIQYLYNDTYSIKTFILQLIELSGLLVFIALNSIGPKESLENVEYSEILYSGSCESILLFIRNNWAYFIILAYLNITTLDIHMRSCSSRKKVFDLYVHNIITAIFQIYNIPYMLYIYLWNNNYDYWIYRLSGSYPIYGIDIIRILYIIPTWSFIISLIYVIYKNNILFEDSVSDIDDEDILIEQMSSQLHRPLVSNELDPESQQTL